MFGYASPPSKSAGFMVVTSSVKSASFSFEYLSSVNGTCDTSEITLLINSSWSSSFASMQLSKWPIVYFSQIRVKSVWNSTELLSMKIE